MTDLLVSTPGNPVPDGAVAGIFHTSEGLRIRYARFPVARERHRGTVLILPGRNEYIEKYFETIRDLATRGFASAALDWRGQGGSQRLIADPYRGHIVSFDDYVTDLDQFFKQVVLPDCSPPYTILAHSAGALVALLAAPKLSNRVQRMVLCAPLLDLAATSFSMRFVHILAELAYCVGLGRLPMSNRQRGNTPAAFSGNPLTSDKARYARNQAILHIRPDLSVPRPTAAWIRAMCHAVKRVRDPSFTARIHVPTLLLAAGRDQVVSTPAIEHYAQRLRSASFLTIDGARHELLQEADAYREQALAVIGTFIAGDHGNH